jgi:putative ABC transport system permease protein
VEILVITLHDLRFRLRQFLITIVGASLVFAMALLLSGMAAGFSAEIHNTVRATSAPWWVISSSASGRIGALPPIPASSVERVAALPGVGRVAPIVVGGQTAEIHSSDLDVVLLGSVPGQLGSTTAAKGEQVRRSGQAVVDSRLHIPLGSRFTIAGVPLTVVGLVNGRTLFAGQPNVYVTLADAQRILFRGRPLIGAVLTTGVPRDVPAGLAARPGREIERASLTQMASAVSSISNTRVLIWAIAAFLVASLIYISALQRSRDFALLKALGASSAMLFAGLAVQAVIVALSAAAIAAAISTRMTGLFAQPVDISGTAYVALPLAAIVVGLLGSVAARAARSRRTLRPRSGASSVGGSRGPRPHGRVPHVGRLRAAPA